MWKVGALAKQTGLSIRMLRYYDQIGLLTPSARTPSGHRLYGPDDVARLQRVLSLRQLGFALEEIGECLRRPEYTLERVVELHLSRVREQIQAQQRIQRRLETIAAHLRAAQTVSVDEFVLIRKLASQADEEFVSGYSAPCERAAFVIVRSLCVPIQPARAQLRSATSGMGTLHLQGVLRAARVHAVRAGAARESAGSPTVRCSIRNS